MAKKLIVAEGEYIPDVGIDYPDDPFQRLVHVDVQDSSAGKYQFDETYEYLDDSFKYKFGRFLDGFLLWCVFSVDNLVRLGLKVKGKENLKLYKDVMKDGAISICNHMYSFDAVAIYQAIKPFGKLWIPMYAKHFNGRFGWLIRHIGGIPVAETTGGTRKFYEAFDTLHERKQWFHIFPEEVRWDWYKPLRPFRKGAFTMAYKYGMPILPLIISYRERTGWRKIFPTKQPLMTLHIGEPIIPDQSIPRKVEIENLRQKAHDTMVEMAGIIQNPWPAVPEDEV